MVNGKEYSVEVLSRAGGRYTVIVDRIEYDVEIPDDAQTKVPSKGSGKPKIKSAAPVKTGIVTAPMAGKILKVSVNIGQAVKKGDVLFVLEAMKMENDINSPGAGIVREIFVTSEEVVDYGQPLGRIE
jgi:biotin carboxyl carrier protein